VRVHLAVEHPLQLEPADAAFEIRGVTLDVARSALVVLALGQLQQFRGVGDGFRSAIELTELGGQLGALAPELLRLVGRLPDGRIFQLPIDLLQALFLGVVLKETP
jgi:hypothetical protein